MNIPNIKEINSGTLADVMDSLGFFGGFTPKIKCLGHSKVRFLGTAYTIKWMQNRKAGDIKAKQDSTWDQVKSFLASEILNGEGLVYVAGTDTGKLVEEMALLGGFSTTDLVKRGFSGAVLGGAIRDAQVINKVGFTVWATGFMPADTQGSYRVVETGTECNVGGQLVRTGDWIFSDETGLISIPSKIAEKVFEGALEVEAKEHLLAKELEEGYSLFEVVNRLGRL
ncbi:RraA family protein [Vibrio splendidus]